MKIDKPNIPETYTQGAGGARPEKGGASRAKAGEPSPQTRKSDSVAFSAAGLALAGSSSISAERVAEIRSRVDSGFYNRPAVAEGVARKLIGRLDA